MRVTLAGERVAIYFSEGLAIYAIAECEYRILTGQMQIWDKSKLILEAERGNKSVYSRKASSFSVGFQFRVMRLVFTHRYEFATQML